MANKIEKGMLVKAGGTIPITTMNLAGRVFEREKVLKPGQFLFGIVQEVGVYGAIVLWDGPKHRTSALPVERLIPAINKIKRAKKTQ